MDQPQPKEDHIDVGVSRVAHVYAAALLRAATKEGSGQTILEEMESLVHDLFDKDPRLEGLVSLIALGRKARRELLEKIFAHRASPVFYNFLLVLNDHERLDMIRPILAELRKLLEQIQGRTRVQVYSATPLSSDQQNRLAGDLRQTCGFEPILEIKVDPNLLGGLKIRIGDWQYDASVRTRIDNLRHQIIARSSHEIQSRRDRFSSAN